MEAAHKNWRPLGELIVERGLISQDQLEDALLEQRVTHKRLGTILVDQGIVTAQSLTDALVDQIGVEDLLDEFDGDESDEDSAPRDFGSQLRKLRGRIEDVDMPSPRRLTAPLSRIRVRPPKLRRNPAEDLPVAPFAPVPQPDFDFEDETPTPAPVVELVQPDDTFELAAVEAAPKPAPEPAPAPVELVVPQEPQEPHTWLTAARQALESAEADLAQLDGDLARHTRELDETRTQLAGSEADLAREADGHRRAEEEITRLHSLLDERDTSLTELETTIEGLYERETAVRTELTGMRAALGKASVDLESIVTTLNERNARVQALEAVAKENERRGTHISELEAQVAEMTENLSATDETLGIEMHAREQAQREAKRLQDELDDRDSRLTKLARQVETLEAELEVVVAEREQATRKLRSRERRVGKLETTLAELQTAAEQASEAEAQPAEADAPEIEEPEAQAEPEAAQDGAEAEAEAAQDEPEAEAAAEPEAEPEAAEAAEPAPADAEQTTGFLYFVPREGEGYELREQSEGEPPAVGDKVELDGSSFEVTRHGRSPKPFDRRVCVYLRFS